MVELGDDDISVRQRVGGRELFQRGPAVTQLNPDPRRGGLRDAGPESPNL